MQTVKNGGAQWSKIRHRRQCRCIRTAVSEISFGIQLMNVMKFWLKLSDLPRWGHREHHCALASIFIILTCQTQWFPHFIWRHIYIGSFNLTRNLAYVLNRFHCYYWVVFSHDFMIHYEPNAQLPIYRTNLPMCVCVYAHETANLIKINCHECMNIFFHIFISFSLSLCVRVFVFAIVLLNTEKTEN